VEAQYELLDSAVHLPLSQPLNPGDQVIVGMDYSVEIPPEMSGNYGLFGYIDGTLVLHHIYPVIPVYDDEGWNVEIPPLQGDVSYYDASFYLVRVNAPASMVMAASGSEFDRTTEGNRQIVTYVAGPARDFYLAASDNFSVLSKRYGETAINSYFLPGLEQGAELTLVYASNALKCYSERLGPYPYAELDLVSTPMQALGMEYAGITAIANTLYDPDEVVSGLASQIILESTVAHEIAHQWFFNAVGNDQVDEPWMDEAIVQYFTGIYYADTYGPDSYEGLRNSWMDRWGRVEYAEIPIGMTTGFYTGSEYGAIVYGRGPLFIEALAQEMGEDVFNAFIRDYYESNRWDVGTAAEFRELAESHCNCDLTALFEEWVYE
jgi:aminopeptidase N